MTNSFHYNRFSFVNNIEVDLNLESCTLNDAFSVYSMLGSTAISLPIFLSNYLIVFKANANGAFAISFLLFPFL